MSPDNIHIFTGERWETPKDDEEFEKIKKKTIDNFFPKKDNGD